MPPNVVDASCLFSTQVYREFHKNSKFGVLNADPILEKSEKKFNAD